MKHRETATARFVRRLLLLFPRRFRQRHAEDLIELYTDLERKGRAPSRLSVLLDLMTNGLCARFENRGRRTSTAPRNSGASLLDSWRQDLRFAGRGLRRRPMFTAVAVSTLALGIGANTAIFSVVHGVLLRPLDFSEPERLVHVWHRSMDGSYLRGNVTPGNFNDLRDRSTQVDTLAAVWRTAATLESGVDIERLRSQRVTGDFFTVLGTDAVLGRTLTMADDEPGAEPAVVLSHGLWRRLFGGSAEALGETVRLDGIVHTVVGVMPAHFHVLSTADLWQASGWSAAFRSDRTEYSYAVIGRLAPGAGCHPHAGPDRNVGRDGRLAAALHSRERRPRRLRRAATSGIDSRRRNTSLVVDDLSDPGPAHRVRQPGQPPVRARSRAPAGDCSP
ncbi:MAG: ABC transporter permease [Thermoanaerobaculia bacterium]|nr:ABC transporter permease [Thermoanaerobaculia bacterium]